MSFEIIKEEILDNIADFQKGFAFKSVDFQKCGIKIVKVSNLTMESIDADSCISIDELKANQYKRYELLEDDIIITTVGSWPTNPSSVVGKVVRVPYALNNTLLNQNAVRVRAKSDINQNYLFYLLKSHIFKNYIIGTAQGSANQASITQSDIKKFKYRIHNSQQQEVIGESLRLLDKKIELNNAMNKNLEEMAHVLFKRWFIDFEFPNENDEPYKSSGGAFEESELGLIPKGWRAGKFSELVTVKYGKDHKKLNDGFVPVYGSGGIMRYVDKVLYSDESVLIPRKGTLNNVMYINKPFWSVDTMFYTVMNVPYIAKFIYFFVSSKDLVSMNVGSAVPSMTTDILNKMPIVIPREDVLEEFDRIASALFDKIHNLIIENKKLADIRDSLLPKLISGEIRVQMDQEDSYTAQTVDLPLVAESSEKYSAH